ncbi:PREDICTED: uncharacterized protein LOC109389429 [Hipposideros armiger]|uniref:Uncharacterized protein LOC109389429 n=1 Tax=Hipposideros armiger TaxID=186990 RepID=A0A8B7SCZ1_HIPAR|nr:PREDICTED: uncharacterized protein LOC109389429 [Hipposideros armiger]
MGVDDDTRLLTSLKMQSSLLLSVDNRIGSVDETINNLEHINSWMNHDTTFESCVDKGEEKTQSVKESLQLQECPWCKEQLGILKELDGRSDVQASILHCNCHCGSIQEHRLLRFQKLLPLTEEESLPTGKKLGNRERSISEISLEVENIVKSQFSPGIYYTFPREPEEENKICAKAKLHFPCHTSKKDILIYRPTAKPLRDGPMGDKLPPGAHVLLGLSRSTTWPVPGQGRIEFVSVRMSHHLSFCFILVCVLDFPCSPALDKRYLSSESEVVS